MFEDALDVLTHRLGRWNTLLLAEHVDLNVDEEEDTTREAWGVLVRVG